MKNAYIIFRKLHLLFSIPFGIFIFLIAFSGAMMSFEKEITSFLLNPNLAELSGKPLRLPFFAVMREIHGELALGTFGRVLVGLSMWGLVVILVSGIIMWYKTANYMTKI